MRRFMLALAGVTALTAASAANATITIGATATTPGSTFAITGVDNVGVPKTIDFKTTTDASGAASSYFEFTNTETGFYNFSLITSTLGGTVNLAQLLSGGGVNILQQSTGTSNTISLLTGNLMAGATYRFWYTSNFGTGGGVTSGNASFYVAGVPEPATWGLMLLGFAGIGMAMRYRRRPALAQIA